MAYHIPDNDNEEDDARRIAQALCVFLRPTVSALKTLMFELREERSFVERMDLLLAAGSAPNDADVRRIKDLAWKYRRKLPKGRAPVLPPHDPIVQEMERNHG
jgi:hypothetical protein